MNQKIRRFLPQIWASEDLLLRFLAVALLAAVSFIGLGKCGFAYAKMQETRQQIRMMSAFVADWERESARLGQMDCRPVNEAQVDDVQSKILLNLSSNRLDLVSFRSVNGDKKDSGRRYELTCRGAWDSTVRMLEKFRAKDALLSIQHLKLEPERSGGIRATIEYKIYMK